MKKDKKNKDDYTKLKDDIRSAKIDDDIVAAFASVPNRDVMVKDSLEGYKERGEYNDQSIQRAYDNAEEMIWEAEVEVIKKHRELFRSDEFDASREKIRKILNYAAY
ncbi:MAG: hypothetical protein ACRC0J_01365 [Shewanella oncorhynchi]